jgi:WG containing repeat
VSGFSEGVAAAVANKSKTGFVDRSGTVAIPLKYGNAGEFSERLAWVVLADKMRIHRSPGKQVLPLRYTACGDFSEGVAHVYEHGVMGYIDKQREWIITSALSKRIVLLFIKDSQPSRPAICSGTSTIRARS